MATAAQPTTSKMQQLIDELIQQLDSLQGVNGTEDMSLRLARAYAFGLADQIERLAPPASSEVRKNLADAP